MTTQTLQFLIAEHNATAYIFADRGNGCAFGEAGQAIPYGDDDAEQYGQALLYPLAEPIVSNDGIECTLASEWQDGENGYQWRILF